MEESSRGRNKIGSIYQVGLRVPATLEWPGRYPSGTIDTPAYTSDIYPPVLSIAGAHVQHRPALDRIDLTTVLAWHSPQWDRVQLAACQGAGNRGMTGDLIAGSDCPFGTRW